MNKNSQNFGRLLLVLLLFITFSAFATTQERHTVERPIPVATLPIVTLAEETPVQHAPIRWETDFERAKSIAKTSSRQLLIYLYADGNQEMPEAMADIPVIPASEKFNADVLDDQSVRSGLDGYVLLKLPMDTKTTNEEGTECSIYSLPGFEHMLEHPGLVVIDFAHRDMPYYGEVVGVLPFLRGQSPTAEQTVVFLNLPPGTLTQRTLTYAVRIHPDQPQSANGIPAPIVVQMATEHAEFQAERGVLGHHNYSLRVYQAREVLGGGSPAEICAQSRPGLGLFEGAIACMRLWRNSPAHWSIARRSHTYFGYDMAQGSNGAWYAVGFFIN